MTEEMDNWVAELLAINDAEEKMTDKQMKIVKAAIEIFSEKGFAASSTSEIAQKAGVAEGTIFRHYKTKKGLLLSIVAPLITKLIAPFILKDFLKVLDSSYVTFEDFLRAIVSNRIQFVKKNMPLLKILLQEIPFHAELQEQYKAMVAKQVLTRFKRSFEHFQQKGMIIDIPPLSAVRMAGSTILGYVFTRYLLAPQLDWDEQKEVDYMVHYIMHGLGIRKTSNDVLRG